jgi:large subunit ribosomal protein L9
MQVILLDDVLGLGDAGDLVKVKTGYARNYLIPQGLAQHATKDGLNRIEAIRRAGEERRRKLIHEVKDKVEALDGKKLTVPMKVGSEAKIFGAVTTLLLQEKILEEFEMEVDRRYIMLEAPIKYLGTYDITLKAGAEASAVLKLHVVDESQPEAPAPKAKPKAEKVAAAVEASEPPAEEAAAVEEQEGEREELASEIEEKLQDQG